MMAKGNFTLGKTGKWNQLFDAFSFVIRAREAHYFALCPHFPRVTRLKDCLMFIRSSRAGAVFFRGSGWLRLEFPSAINSIMIRNCYNTEAVENNLKTWMTMIQRLGGIETLWHVCCSRAARVMKQCTQPTFNLLVCQKSSSYFYINTSCRGLNEVNSPQRSANAVRCHVFIPADPRTLCREIFVHKVVVVMLILWDYGPWIQLIKIKWNVFFWQPRVSEWQSVRPLSDFHREEAAQG